MAQHRLTDKMIGRIPAAAPGRRAEYGDAVVPGLSLRVTDRGHKSFCLYYYNLQNRHRRFTIGIWPDTPLSTAREKARIARRQVAAGKDPAIETRRATRQLVNGAIDLFIDRHVKRNNRPSTARETIRKLNGYILPAWDARPIASIDRRDVAKLIQSIADQGAPVMADRVLATVSKFFNWALVQPEYIDLLKANPVVRNMSPVKVCKRDRVLSLSEIRQLWSVTDKTGYPFGAFTRLLLLTGQRRGEVAGVRWSQLDLETATWHLPATSTKTGRSHDVPLSMVACDLLAGLPRYEGDYVFTTRGGQVPVSGFSKAKKCLDAHLPQFEGWRFHDLRRTFATQLEDLNVTRPVIASLLNHAGGSVTDIYTRAALVREKRAAVENLGRHILGAETAPDRVANIIPFRR